MGGGVESADWGGGIHVKKEERRPEDKGRESEGRGIVVRLSDYAITMGTSSAKPPIIGSSSSSSPFGGRKKQTNNNK